MLPLTSHQKKTNKLTHYSLFNILDLKYSLTDDKLNSLSSSVELKNFLPHLFQKILYQQHLQGERRRMKITVLNRLTIRYEIMAMTCYQLQVIYTRVLFSSRSQVSKSWRTNVYLYVHVCIYVAIGEKNRETILLSLQACFVIAHSSRDYMRVCVCVHVRVWTEAWYHALIDICIWEKKL